jgi:hypothetical protein
VSEDVRVNKVDGPTGCSFRRSPSL